VDKRKVIKKEELTEIIKSTIAEVIKPVTSANEWKSKSINKKQITLPSGTVVEIRKVNLFDCISANYIPLESFQRMLSVGESLQSSKGFEKLKVEDLTDLISIVRKIACRAVVNPIITETITNEENTIFVGEIGEEDLLFIFGEVMKGGKLTIDSFR
jgi:hypothetical protein